MLQQEEQDPDLPFREIAKFGILQIAGMFSYKMICIDDLTVYVHVVSSHF